MATRDAEFVETMRRIEEASRDICYSIERLPDGTRCRYGVCVREVDDGFELFLRTANGVYNCGKYRSVIHVVATIKRELETSSVVKALAIIEKLRDAMYPLARYVSMNRLPEELGRVLRELGVREFSEVKLSRVPRLFQEVLAVEKLYTISIPELVIRCGLREYRIPVSDERPAERILAIYEAIRRGHETNDVEVDALLTKCSDELTVAIDFVPRLTILRTMDNRVIVYDGVARSGRIEGYVENLSGMELYNRISHYLTKHTLNQINAKFRKVLGAPLYNHDGVVTDFSRDAILWVTKKLPEPIARSIARDWSHYLEQLFHPYDRTMAYLYKPYVIEYPYVRVAPHGIFITNPHTGKSTLADALGIRLDRATPVALVGGMNPETRRIEEGIVHGIKHLVQIEGLESGKEIDTIRYVLNLMAMGVAESGVGTRTVVTKCSAPLAFTANTSRVTRDREAEAAKLLYNLSFENPMALAHRIAIPAYLSDLSTVRIVSPSEEWVSTKNIVRVFRSSTFDTYSRIFCDRRVQEWLASEPDEWEGVRKLRSDVENLKLENLRKFLAEYVEKGFVKAKTHALGAAIAENLGQIVLGKMGVEEIIDAANEILKNFTLPVVTRSIMNMIGLEMAIAKSEILEKILSKSERALLCAVLNYVNAVNPQEKRVEDLEYVLSYASDYIRNNLSRTSIAKLASLLSRKPTGFLKEFGIEILGKSVVIDPTIVRNLEGIIKKLVS